MSARKKIPNTSENNKGLFKSWPEVILFYFVGLSIFFTVAFIIVALRISFKQEIKVPALVGKMYLDEHNALQESGFQIKFEKVHSVNYPYGYIISQSLSAHKVVKYGQKLVLLVNESRNVVETPRIVGSLESLAPKILSNVHSGKRRFKLNPGIITKIPSERPKGEIIAQFPLPRTPVKPESPVSFLVSLGAQNNKQAYLNLNAADPFDLNQKKNQSIEIVKSLAYHLKIPLDIKPIVTQNIEKNAIVLESTFPKNWLNNLSEGSSKKKANDQPQKNLVWRVKVGQYQDKQDQDEYEDEFPFRFIWLTPDEIGVDEGFYTISQKKDLDYSQFSYVKLKEDRPVPVFKRLHEQFFFWENYHSSTVEQPTKVYKADDIEP